LVHAVRGRYALGLVRNGICHRSTSPRRAHSACPVPDR
jgi:hypothetical protein